MSVCVRHVEPSQPCPYRRERVWAATFHRAAQFSHALWDATLQSRAERLRESVGLLALQGAVLCDSGALNGFFKCPIESSDRAWQGKLDGGFPGMCVGAVDGVLERPGGFVEGMAPSVC